MTEICYSSVANSQQEIFDIRRWKLEANGNDIVHKSSVNGFCPAVLAHYRQCPRRKIYADEENGFVGRTKFRFQRKKSWEIRVRQIVRDIVNLWIELGNNITIGEEYFSINEIWLALIGNRPDVTRCEFFNPRSNV